MRYPILSATTAAVVLGPLLGAAPAGPPYQATGFKIGEVTDTTAIVWTRLTRKPQRNSSDAPMVEILFEQGGASSAKKKARRRRKVAGVTYPEGITVADIRDAVPGAPGLVRVAYRTAGGGPLRTTAWQAVDPDRDFTRQLRLEDLKPNTGYTVRVESRATEEGPPGLALEGSFTTAPRAADPARVVFTVSTGQGYGSQDCPEGYRMYPAMAALAPSFFVHTGDIVYYDRLAKNLALARYHWQRTYSLPTNVAFHRRVASYFIKDDHDTWQNDCWPTMKSDMMLDFTFAQGQAVFREQVPMGPSTYRTYRWGKDLQVWLVEGRDFRSANPDPDGPEKTIWGAAQKAWFKRTVRESDATFRILISPTPLVGPDRTNKNDNHANRGFTHEGDEMRLFIAGQKNMVTVCGDRHWQYVSVHPGTGVREYSCGPVSDKHAGGWSNDKYVREYHRYLNVVGGFLSATVERANGTPTLTFRHHHVDGKILNEDRLVAK
jgi:alkaline phosphatase D